MSSLSASSLAENVARVFCFFCFVERIEFGARNYFIRSLLGAAMETVVLLGNCFVGELGDYNGGIGGNKGGNVMVRGNNHLPLNINHN